MKIFLDMPKSETFPSFRAVSCKRLEVACHQIQDCSRKEKEDHPHGKAAQDASDTADLKSCARILQTEKKGLTENPMLIHT